MRPGAWALLPTVLAACGQAESPPPVGVLVDGLFDEWTTAATIIDDPPDAPDSPVDFLSVQGLDEPGWLFLALDIGNEVTLQSLPGTVHLLLDTDAEASTGGTLYGVDGVDLVVDFSQTLEPLAERRGLGFALRVVGADGTPVAIPRHSLGLTALPTSSAPRFEIRISRRGASRVEPFGARLRLAAVYSEAGEVLDQTLIGSYRFRTSSGPPTVPSVGARLARAPGSVRVAQWNVSWQDFPPRAEDFARVLAALEPDVILLDELPGDLNAGQIAMTSEQLTAFFMSEPLARLGTWRFVYGESGGYQRALVAARDRDIRPAEPMTHVRHPVGALEALLAGAPADLRRFLEFDDQSGPPAAGAWVELDGQEVLFVAMDLQSRGWLGSPRDLHRRVQATTIRDHIAAALGDSGAPVVIGGDLNLVGSRAPLFALVRSLDVDGSDLVAVDAERLGERSLTTWRNPDDVFLPGRLDYVLVADAGLSVTNAFVFATEDLDDATLVRLGLTRGLSLQLSDHLVSVVDVRLR